MSNFFKKNIGYFAMFGAVIGFGSGPPFVKLALQEFSKKRDWDQFHTLKNLAMALSVEASELLEIFQWSRNKKNAKLKGLELGLEHFEA